MKSGKISDSVLKRTVLKSIGKSPKGCEKPAVGKDGAVMTFGSEKPDAVVMGTAVIVGDDQKDIISAINCSANNVASSGFIPSGMVLDIILPEDTEESALRKYMEAAYNTAASLDMGITGGHTEVSDYVSKPVFSVVSTGVRSMGAFKEKEDKMAYDIVMSGYAGYEGAARILDLCNEEYSRIFSAEYIKHAGEALCGLSIAKEAAVAVQHGVIAMHDIHSSGVFGALWELGEQMKTGLTVDIRKIPIKQATVEICERVEVNPYVLSSMGALLMVTKNGRELVGKLKCAGIPAEVIGCTTDKKERVLLNKGEKRFLDKPGTDELIRIKKLKEEKKLCVRKY